MVNLIIFFYFADYLYEEGDYSRAAIEYRRLIYQYPESTRFYMRAGDSYFNIQDYKKSIKFYKLLLGTEKEDTASVRLMVSFLILHLPDSAQNYLGYTGKFRKDMENLIRFVKGDLEAYEYFNIPHHKRKSPLIAGILSLFPGLGKFYAGRGSDACFSLSTIPLFGGLSYYYYSEKNYYAASFFTLLTLLFYSGEIYGSINSALKYNRYISKKELLTVLNGDIISPLLP